MQINLNEALNLLKEGKIHQAKNLCEKILENDNTNSEVHNLHAFTLYFENKFDESIDSWKRALKINPKYIEALNGQGNAFLKLKKIDMAIQNFEKAIKINPNFFEAYSNLGTCFLRLNKYQDAIHYFDESIKINPNHSKSIYGKAYSLSKNRNFSEAVIFFDKFIKLNPLSSDAYNAAGCCLISLNEFENSLNYFTKAINLQPNHKDANENLINLIKFHEPEKDYSNLILKLNKKIRLIKFEFDHKTEIKDEKIIDYFNKVYEILGKNLDFNNFKEEQIFRRNELVLNCDRHFKVFKTYDVIPEYCFGCYKIQIDLKNIIELFKLHFIFDKFEFEGNNIRKTMIETRPDVKGTYKGLIYCSGLDEAKKILDKVEPIIQLNIDQRTKIFIKRGCTEFSISYPNFDKTDQSVKYNNVWKKKEEEIDKNYFFDKDTTLKNSIFGLSISDALTMKNWLFYAKKIDDLNYKKFSFEIDDNDHLEKKLFDQETFRKKEFLKTKQL